MGVVKIAFIKHAGNLIQYVLGEKGPGDIVDSHDCSPDTAAQDFQLFRNVHSGKGTVEAVHVIQSWNKEESAKFSPEEFNLLGRRLIEGHFPGHGFLIVTHTGTGNTHNHIAVCPWNTETGQKIEHKKRHLYQLRDLNDSLSKEKGLSVIERSAKERPINLPDNVWKMVMADRRSHMIDLVNKADLARAYATNFNEYVGLMGEFGVAVRCEKKNITYFYPGIERGKRGDKLGRKYDLQGLEEGFRSNDLKFREHRGLRDYVAGKIDTAKGKPGLFNEVASELEKNAGNVFERSVKDYSKKEILPRREWTKEYPHEIKFQSSMIPIEEIRRAKRENILDYCRHNNIKTERNKDGATILSGRAYVVLSDYEWVNKKNGTRGTLIEFVAAHKNLTLLQAISDINKNPRLLMLEKTFGVEKKGFKSFYIPKEEKMEDSRALSELRFFLRGHGVTQDVGESLLKSERVHIDKSGLIRFFGEEGDKGAVEFEREEKGAGWKKKTHGAVNSPFISRSNPSEKTATVFLDPFSALKAGGRAVFDGGYRGNVLTLLQPDKEVIDRYVAGNPHIERLEIFSFHAEKPSRVELDLFNNLKHRYQNFGIDVSFNDKTPQLSRDVPEISFF